MTSAKRRLTGCLLGAIATVSVLAFPASGCGGTGHDAEGGADSAAESDHTRDAGNEANRDAAADGCGVPHEGGPALPVGATSLVNTERAGFCNVELIGLTDDDAFAVYYGKASSGPGVFAAPLAGGTSATIVAGGSSGGSVLTGFGYSGDVRATVVHSTVFVWTQVTTNAATGASVGALTAIWTPTYGVQAPLASSSAVGIAWASPDSLEVAFTANVDPEGGTGGDFIAFHSDLSGGQILIQRSAPTVFSDVGFVDDTHLVAAYQEPADSGVSHRILSSWRRGPGADGGGPVWSMTELLTDVLAPNSAFTWGADVTSLSVDGGSGDASVEAGLLESGLPESALPESGLPESGHPEASVTDSGGLDSGTTITILAVRTNSELDAIPIAGGTPMQIATGVSSFYVEPDGSGVLYGTTNGGYRFIPLPGGPSTEILPSGSHYDGFLDGPPIAVSPDGNWSTFYTATGKPAGAYDLHLVRNVPSATAIALHGASSGAILGDAFTGDSAYALYVTDPTAEGDAGLVGSLQAFRVGGSKGFTVSSKSAHGWRDLDLEGSRVLFAADFKVDRAVSPGVADLFTVDVAGPLDPRLIIERADANYFLTTARPGLTRRVVFALNKGNTSTNGIYSYVP